MATLFAIDWHTLFVPSGSLLELVIRGSFLYLSILAAMRLLRRDAGSLGTADLLVVVLVADAAQNGMTGEYKSITEGLVLVVVIFGWDYTVDALAYRYPFVHRLVHPAPLPLILNGRVLPRNLRSEMLTISDLREQLREQGIEEIAVVKRCILEGDGRLSVIKYEPDEESGHPERKRGG